MRNTGFLNLPGTPEIASEDLAGFGLGARLAQRQVVPERGVPLLIKALGVHRKGVDADARRILGQVAGHDLGTEPEPWLEWWRSHQGLDFGLVSCGDPHCALAC